MSAKLLSSLTVAALLLAPLSSQAQLPRDPVERARIISQIMETQSRQLTLFDRQGQTVGVVGPRDLYNQPVFSPDAKRMAVIKPDLDKETNDLWIIDVATAKGVQITSSKSREGANSPAWSPDGSQVAYVALRDGYFGLYRKASSGQGTEELLFKNSAPMTLTDWSQDGGHLTYFSTDLSGGGLYALPLGRLRARGELVEVRAHELSFTSDEADRLLNDHFSLDLTRADVDGLVERTEGWPAGVYLAV